MKEHRISATATQSVKAWKRTCPLLSYVLLLLITSRIARQPEAALSRHLALSTLALAALAIDASDVDSVAFRVYERAQKRGSDEEMKRWIFIVFIACTS